MSWKTPRLKHPEMVYAGRVRLVAGLSARTNSVSACSQSLGTVRLLLAVRVPGYRDRIELPNPFEK